MNHDMNIIGLFPVSLASTTVDLPDASLIKWQHQTDFKQSVYDLHTIAEWQTFASTITDYCARYLTEIGYKSQTVWITQMWANEYPAGTGIPTHVHSNSLLSGCVYFDNNSPTVFYNQRQKQLEMIQIPVETVTAYNSEYFTVEAIKGRMVVWPSWMPHSSEPAKGTRLTVSFNILPEELGKPDGFNYVDLRRS